MGQFTPVLALYHPFGVDVPLNFDIIIIIIIIIILNSYLQCVAYTAMVITMAAIDTGKHT